MAFEPAQHSFITLEGVDGAGKSTQARLLARALELAGYQVVSLREPGGTAISEKIRALLLDPANTAMGDTCELLLYEAARAQLVHEVIAPALTAGKVVLCDRFYDSTTCYQAFADGLDRQMVRDANNLAVAGTHPALTLVYHITPEQAALRMAARGAADRMEAKGMAFQERVYQGFCAIAAEEPNRVKLIDATASIEEVFAQTVERVRAYGLDISQDAVAAVRPAAGHELFTPERHAAVAALAGPDLDSSFVHKTHEKSPGCHHPDLRDALRAYRRPQGPEKSKKGKKPCGLFPSKITPCRAVIRQRGLPHARG